MFGARVCAKVSFVTFDAGFASFYNVSYDANSSVLPISGTTFPTDTTNVGFKHSLLATDGMSIIGIGQPIPDQIAAIDNALGPNQATTGSIIHTGALTRRFTMPINLSLTIPVDTDPSHDLHASATGTIVANATLPAPSGASVVGTNLFYKGSTRFNVTNNNLPGFSDDNAIAPDKTAYLPGGGAAAFSAVSSYSRGINGLMVDVASAHGTITANDFTFKVGNNNSPSAWAAATAPTTVTTRSGAGTSGSDRVELMWANNAIQKQWLEVIVEGNDALGGFNTNTGLASSYVFYFGNALGDAGVSDPTTFLVSGADEQSARNNPKSTLGTPALITDVNDFNRDGNVNTTDQQIPRNNTTNAITTALKFLTVGAGGPFAPTSEGQASADLRKAQGGDRGISSAIAIPSPQSTSSRPVDSLTTSSTQAAGLPPTVTGACWRPTKSLPALAVTMKRLTCSGSSRCSFQPPVRDGERALGPSDEAG